LGATAEDLSIKIFLLMENRLLRESLSRVCRKRYDLRVVKEAGFDDASRQLCDDSNVVALDFFNPKWLQNCRVGKDQKILLIGMDNDEALFLEAVKTGISGYLLKDASATDVIGAIRAVYKGEAVCSPTLCSALFDFVARSSSKELCPSPAQAELTLRQRQLVGLVAKGLTNKEIAAHLNLSEFTVRNHIHRILKLADVKTRREAVNLYFTADVTKSSFESRRSRSYGAYARGTFPELFRLRP
jgi:two-component system NarL family response regulator